MPVAHPTRKGRSLDILRMRRKTKGRGKTITLTVGSEIYERLQEKSREKHVTIQLLLRAVILPHFFQAQNDTGPVNNRKPEQ